MRTLFLFASFTMMVGLLIACGKLNDNFSRLRHDYTLVRFGAAERGEFEALGSQSGGVMIYIMNQAGGGQGMVLGYSDEDIANQTAIAIPNGTYRFYVLGFSSGSYVGGGQARCGYGNGGQSVTLNGTAQKVTVDLGMSKCGFGADSAFSYAQNSNTSASNFDDWIIQLCSGNPYPSCTTATSSSHGVRVTLMAGVGGGGQTIQENEARQLKSACIAESSGSFSFSSNKFNAPFARGFVMPVKIEFYSDTSCSTLARTFRFNDGLRDYTATSSSSTTYVDFAASSNSTYVKFYQDF